MWYHSAMATPRTRSSKPSKDAAYLQRLREHYRPFLTTVDGRPYNPLLDEPKSEDGNRLGWSHGQFQGYSVAGCRCTLCTQANTDKQDAGYHSRLTKLKATNEARLHALVTAHRSDLDEAATRTAIEAVMQTAIEERARGHKPRLTFRPELVGFALQAAAANIGAAPWDQTALVVFADEFCGTREGRS